MDSAIALVPATSSLSAYASLIDLYFGISILEAVSHSELENMQQSRTFSLAEHDIYGSSRLGVKKYWPGQIGAVYNYTANTADTTRLFKRKPWYSLEYSDVVIDTMRTAYGNSLLTNYAMTHTRGQKQYELTDHLGDVLATISDARQPDTTRGSDTILYYLPIVQSMTDYYPFGMQMPGRNIADTNTHCTVQTNTQQVMIEGGHTISWATRSPVPYGGAVQQTTYTATTMITTTLNEGERDTIKGWCRAYRSRCMCCAERKRHLLGKHIRWPHGHRHHAGLYVIAWRFIRHLHHQLHPHHQQRYSKYSQPAIRLRLYNHQPAGSSGYVTNYTDYGK